MSIHILTRRAPSGNAGGADRPGRDLFAAAAKLTDDPFASLWFRALAAGDYRPPPWQDVDPCELCSRRGSGCTAAYCATLRVPLRPTEVPA